MDAEAANAAMGKTRSLSKFALFPHTLCSAVNIPQYYTASEYLAGWLLLVCQPSGQTAKLKSGWNRLRVPQEGDSVTSRKNNSSVTTCNSGSHPWLCIFMVFPPDTGYLCTCKACCGLWHPKDKPVCARLLSMRINEAWEDDDVISICGEVFFYGSCFLICLIMRIIRLWVWLCVVSTFFSWHSFFQFNLFTSSEEDCWTKGKMKTDKNRLMSVFRRRSLYSCHILPSKGSLLIQRTRGYKNSTHSNENFVHDDFKVIRTRKEKQDHYGAKEASRLSSLLPPTPPLLSQHLT